MTKKHSDPKSENHFRTVEPKILYFGTPVALISSLNEDGTTNLAPMSSFWALGWTMVLGVLDHTKTAENLSRLSADCVINLPDPQLWREVEKLAPLTGKDPVPPLKASQFRYEHDKFAAANLTPIESVSVRPARALECPVQLEAMVRQRNAMQGDKLMQLGGGFAFEVEVVKVHIAADLLAGESHVDPSKWSPLIYNFRHYFQLNKQELGKTFRAEV